MNNKSTMIQISTNTFTCWSFLIASTAKWKGGNPERRTQSLFGFEWQTINEHAKTPSKSMITTNPRPQISESQFKNYQHKSSPSWAYKWAPIFQWSALPRQPQIDCRGRERWIGVQPEPPCQAPRPRRPSPSAAVAAPIAKRCGSDFLPASWDGSNPLLFCCRADRRWCRLICRRSLGFAASRRRERQVYRWIRRVELSLKIISNARLPNRVVGSKSPGQIIWSIEFKLISF